MKVEVVAILSHPSKRFWPPDVMLSGGPDDRLEAALEMAMIVLRMRSRFPDGVMAPSPVRARTLKFRNA
jgi:hypothetical protein